MAPTNPPTCPACKHAMTISNGDSPYWWCNMCRWFGPTDDATGEKVWRIIGTPTPDLATVVREGFELVAAAVLMAVCIKKTTYGDAANDVLNLAGQFATRRKA